MNPAEIRISRSEMEERTDRSAERHRGRIKPTSPRFTQLHLAPLTVYDGVIAPGRRISIFGKCPVRTFPYPSGRAFTPPSFCARPLLSRGEIAGGPSSARRSGSAPGTAARSRDSSCLGADR
jgi:hypothetical protein